VLELLAEAWRRRLTFTIGTSVTTGESNTVVWNEIHHKTSITNDRGHGYPDPNYLDNVIAELAAQGVEDNWLSLSVTVINPFEDEKIKFCSRKLFSYNIYTVVQKKLHKV